LADAEHYLSNGYLEAQARIDFLSPSFRSPGWYLRSPTTAFPGEYFAANGQYLEKLPIRTISFSDLRDKARHDRVVTRVGRMLDLNKRKHSGNLAPAWDGIGGPRNRCHE
jgi:hypothetical protein